LCAKPAVFATLFFISRLGVYQDGPFSVVDGADGLRLSPDPADAPFLTFVCGVAEAFDSLELFARVEATAPPGSRALLPEGVGLVRLPAYGTLLNAAAVARATFGTARAFWRGLDRVDVVWAFGPHPFELVLVLLAVVRRKRVVLGVRQDTPAYFRARVPSRRWRPVLAFIDGLDALNRLVARRIPATVVGEENAGRYAAGGADVAVIAPSLVRAENVVAEPAARDWDGAITLLTVGRVDREKNPLLLVECMAALEQDQPGRYDLKWVGEGPLLDDVQEHAAKLGVRDRIEFLGYVPFGPGLLELYRGAHAFVHVSLTEGTPQVLVEALASGTPVVATAVGGVRRALDAGRAGVLIPPNDRDALIGALDGLSADPALRERLVAAGLELARGRTLEAESARVAAFLAKSAGQT
jgi:glycosyltransferase involved in cell wall biosynthesis